MLSPLRVKSGRKLDHSITSAIGGKAVSLAEPSKRLLMAISGHSCQLSGHHVVGDPLGHNAFVGDL